MAVNEISLGKQNKVGWTDTFTLLLVKLVT